MTSLGPVLAVKIGNIVTARPQTGPGQADIVYVLPLRAASAGSVPCSPLTSPPVVGPVRRARDDDLQLLRQFGRPAFAYSRSPAPAAAGGGADPHRGPLRRAGRRLLPDTSRVAPHNLYARTRQLLAEAHGARTAHDVGFRFGPAPSGGRVTAAKSVSYPAASFTFRWSSGTGRWLVWMDGSAALARPTAGVPARGGATVGGQLGAATVVIQYNRVGSSRFREWGGSAPYAYSTYVIWHCWQDSVAYDPAKHHGLQALLNKDQQTAA